MKTQWYKLLSRDEVDITTISQIDVVFYDLIWQTLKRKNIEIFFSFFKGRNFTHYIGVNPKKVACFTYKKYFSDKKQIIKYCQYGKKLQEKIKKDTSKWSNRLNIKSNNQEFILAYDDFRKSFKKISYIYSISSWLAIEVWQDDFDDLINGLIIKNGCQKDAESIRSAIYMPWKKTALAEIQSDVDNGLNPEIIADEYQFLRSWAVIWYKPLTKKWVQSLRVSKKDNVLKKYSSKKILELLKPSASEKKMLDMAPYFIFFKDYRDDLRRFHAYSWSFLFNEIEKKYNIKRDNIGYFAVDEIEQFLKKGKFDTQLANLRKKACIITASGSGLNMKVINGIPRKYQHIINGIEKQKQEKIVKGVTAFPGVVKGTVKIIRSVHDIKRFNKNKILVANTTHPIYLPAMKKAAAFVTNEGGVISHAAIIAREIKKPCIVGTKNATKILEDGDLVEVDANKGLVRKINK